jgi:hypothetical protein
MELDEKDRESIAFFRAESLVIADRLMQKTRFKILTRNALAATIYYKTAFYYKKQHFGINSQNLYQVRI